MHGAVRGLGLSILTSRLGLTTRLGLLFVCGWEGAVTVGFISGWGFESPVVSASGSIGAIVAIGATGIFGATGAIGDAAPLVSNGSSSLTTIAGTSL